MQALYLKAADSQFNLNKMYKEHAEERQQSRSLPRPRCEIGGNFLHALWWANGLQEKKGNKSTHIVTNRAREKHYDPKHQNETANNLSMFYQIAIVVLVQLFSQWCSVKTGGDWIFLTDNIPGNYRCRGPPTEIISVLKSGCKSLLTGKKKSRLNTIVYKCLIWCNIIKYRTPWCIIKAQWSVLLALVIFRLGTARRKKKNIGVWGKAEENPKSLNWD